MDGLGSILGQGAGTGKACPHLGGFPGRGSHGTSEGNESSWPLLQRHTGSVRAAGAIPSPAGTGQQPPDPPEGTQCKAPTQPCPSPAAGMQGRDAHRLPGGGGGDTRPASLPNVQALQETVHSLVAQTAPGESRGTAEQRRVRQESSASRWQGPVLLPRLRRGVTHHRIPPHRAAGPQSSRPSPAAAWRQPAQSAIKARLIRHPLPSGAGKAGKEVLAGEMLTSEI